MICGKTPCDYRCPNYEEPDDVHHCSICGGVIYEDYEYVENRNGELAHLECLDRETVEWLREEIKTMDYEEE